MRMRAALLLSMAMTVSSLGFVPASGQTAPAATTEHLTSIVDDAAGDVQICESTSCSAAPSGRWSEMDLTGLEVHETSDTFAFTIKVASLTPQGTELPLMESGVYSVYFRNFDRVFRIDVQRFFLAGATYRVTLNALDPARHAYYTVTRDPADITVTEDIANNAITATVLHRDILADGYGAAPHPEMPFTGFHLTSRAMGFQVGAQRGPTGSSKVPTPVATDAMPDTGNATAQLPVFFGVEQTGHVRLRSDIPTRSSNGEATTFVFDVFARNLGSSEDRFNLAASGVPANWEVKLPAEQVTIPGNGTLHLLVLVTTPFSHNHGSFVKFLLEARSVSDPGSVGRLQMGVRYTQPPQPAGHHPQLWLHSLPASDDPTSTVFTTVAPGDTGADASAYMNAEDKDPNDASKPVPASIECFKVGPADCNTITTGSTAAPQVHYQWAIPLSPGLDMGLDFDMAGKGSNLPTAPVFDAFVKTVLPMQGAVFSGRLVYLKSSGTPSQGGGLGGGEGQGNLTVVATIEATTPADIPANTDHFEVKSAVHPAPAGDFIPYQRGASLLLLLDVNFTRIDPQFGPKDPPMLLPGGTIMLPLFEYHDPVSDIFLSNVELVATSKSDRFVNPGEVAVFNLTLVNHGKEADSFKVEVTGTHAPGTQDAWAGLFMPANPVRVEGGGSVPITIAVVVPQAAQRPDAADLVITATSESDFNQRSLLHLYGVVDTDHDWPDERSIYEKLDDGSGQSGRTPGLEFAGLVVAVGVAMLLARRRVA